MPDELHKVLIDSGGSLIICDSQSVKTENSGCVCSTDPLLAKWCPCPQPGCWPLQPVYWIDVEAHTLNNENQTIPIYLCDLLKIGQWCYFPGHTLAHLSEVGPDATTFIGTGSIGRCIHGDCAQAACVPSGGGDCPCGCEKVCYALYPTEFEYPGCPKICCRPNEDAQGNVVPVNIAATLRTGLHVLTLIYQSNEGPRWCIAEGDCCVALNCLLWEYEYTVTGYEPIESPCLRFCLTGTYVHRFHDTSLCRNWPGPGEPPLDCCEYPIVEERGEAPGCIAQIEAFNPELNQEQLEHYDYPNPPCPGGYFDHTKRWMGTCDTIHITLDDYYAASAMGHDPNGDLVCACWQETHYFEELNATISPGPNAVNCCTGCHHSISGCSDIGNSQPCHTHQTEPVGPSDPTNTPSTGTGNPISGGDITVRPRSPRPGVFAFL